MTSRKARWAALIGSTLALLLSPALASAQPSTTVQLLSPGEGPLTELRFQPELGSVQRIKIISQQAIEMQLGDTKIPQQALPATVVTMQLTMVEVDAAGQFKVAFKTVDVNIDQTTGIPPALLQRMRNSLQPLKSLGGEMIVTPRGTVVSARLDTRELPKSAQGIMDNLTKNMNQLVVPLPAGPVGVGARWRVTQNLSEMGMPITQEATVTLEGRDGNQLTLVSEMVQKVREGTVKLPNIPPGVTVYTKASESEGRGRMNVDLTRLGASGDVAMKVNVVLVTEGRGPSQTIRMSMTMSLKMADVSR